MNYPILARYETSLYPFWKRVGTAEVRVGPWATQAPDLVGNGSFVFLWAFWFCTHKQR